MFSLGKSPPNEIGRIHMGDIWKIKRKVILKKEQQLIQASASKIYDQKVHQQNLEDQEVKSIGIPGIMPL